jgi:hypothetical protein
LYTLFFPNVLHTLPISELSSLVLLRKRSISTKRPSHIGEVSANFCG